VSNVLSEEKKQQVIALGQLGWSLRRIQRATRIRRETAAGYLKAAGIAVRPPGGWGRSPAKPAIEVSTDPGGENPPKEGVPRPGRSPSVFFLGSSAFLRTAWFGPVVHLTCTRVSSVSFGGQHATDFWLRTGKRDKRRSS
jgi:hypothetical protein